jgi:isocitrate dehydrogenase
MQNLYGDVISDVAAQIAGSVGLAGSSNIGEDFAMFEAIHGSAPDISGQNKANPSGLINGAIMMLDHIGEVEAASKIQAALLKTIEDGIHTPDIFKASSKELVGTKEFAQAVIANLGKKPTQLKTDDFSKSTQIKITPYVRKPRKEKVLQGVDLFADWQGEEMEDLVKGLKAINTDNLRLEMITNRGVKVWPEGFKETFKTDHWRCRYTNEDGKAIEKEEIIKLLQNAADHGIDAVKTENLYTFDGVRGYSLGQGQ